MASNLSEQNSSAGNFTVVGLGELLWDLFPEGKRLGGAPANFAYIASLLGDHGIVASRIGSDPLGDEVVTRLQHLRLPTDFLQIDSALPTGTVQVSLDSEGQPRYQINQPVAWDSFEMSPRWASLARQASAVSFGTLAQRSAASHQAIVAFLEISGPTAVHVFDVNLRQSFYSAATLCNSARHATVIKLNHEEFPTVLELLGAPKSRDVVRDVKGAGKWLLEATGARLICVTRGVNGSVLIAASEVHEHPGNPTIVADTVGAGDAFCAALVHHYLRGASLALMNEAANRMGSWVASRAGAMPEPDPEILEKVRNPRT